MTQEGPSAAIGLNQSQGREQHVRQMFHHSAVLAIVSESSLFESRIVLKIAGKVVNALPWAAAAFQHVMGGYVARSRVPPSYSRNM